MVCSCTAVLESGEDIGLMDKLLAVEGRKRDYSKEENRTEKQEQKLMNDPQSNSIVPEKTHDPNKFYELLELLEGPSSPKDSEVSSVEDVPNNKNAPGCNKKLGDEDWSYPAQETYCPNGNPYNEQYYMYMHLSNVLERGLTGIHSELNQLSRLIYQLVYGMKECADTMGFYTTRMLAFQKEMLHITSKTNTTLQSGVHLLQDINANNWHERAGRSDENKSKRHYKDIQPRSPEDEGLRYSKRDKKK